MALSTQNVTLVRGKRPVLQDVSISILPGEVLGLLGANGAGKSTLLAALAGELSPTTGAVFLDGDDLNDLRPAVQARRRAVLPQNPSLSFDLSVSEVVAMGAYPFPELSPEQVADLATRALATADVSDLATRRYVELSGGEQQRVQFARVLVQCTAPLFEPASWAAGNRQRSNGETAPSPRASRLPRYLLLDEPIASLDPKHQIALMCAVQNLAHKQGVGVMVILHDINLAARWCDRLVLLSATGIAAFGSPEETLTQAVLRKVFDIDADVLAHPTLPGRRLILTR